MMSFNPHELYKLSILIPIEHMGNWGLGRLSNFPQVTEPVLKSVSLQGLSV